MALIALVMLVGLADPPSASSKQFPEEYTKALDVMLSHGMPKLVTTGYLTAAHWYEFPDGTTTRPVGDMVSQPPDPNKYTKVAIGQQKAK